MDNICILFLELRYLLDNIGSVIFETRGMLSNIGPVIFELRGMLDNIWFVFLELRGMWDGVDINTSTIVPFFDRRLFKIFVLRCGVWRLAINFSPLNPFLLRHTLMNIALKPSFFPIPFNFRFRFLLLHRNHKHVNEIK